MIICSNCGTTNSSDERVCRNCGALLPVSSKAPRIKISPGKKKVKGDKSKVKLSEKKVTQKHPHLDLQEIPIQQNDEILSDDQSIGSKTKPEDIGEAYDKSQVDEEEKEILKEITPQPFKSSLFIAKNVLGSVPIKRKKSSKTVEKSSDLETSLLKQKQLEEDMTKVLKFLSKKITVEKLPSETGVKAKEKKEEIISPASMNEILKELLKLDLHIEASAIIKKDGTILASAISSRITDKLFATIGQSLSLIGTDIIESLSAGKLLNISLRGTHGVLDLAPIDTKTPQGMDMILIILSNPRVKSGIIHFAANIVKKQVKEYLGISK